MDLWFRGRDERRFGRKKKEKYVSSSPTLTTSEIKNKLGEKRSRHLSGTPLTFVKDLPNNTCLPLLPFSSVWGLLVQTNEAHVKSRCSLPPTVNQVTAYSSSAAAGETEIDGPSPSSLRDKKERKGTLLYLSKVL